MKHFTILKSFLLLFALVVGSNVWAEDPDVTYDFTGTDWTVSNGTLSNGTVSFTGAGGASFKMNSGYFMLGKSGAYINFPTYTSAVEKIVVTGRSGASGSVKQNIYVGDVAVSTETEGATGTNSYEIDENYQDAGTQYTLKVTSSHNTQITKIEVFFASGSGTSEKEACDLALTGTTDLEFDLYNNADAQFINYTTSSTGAVTVASSEYIDAEVGDGTITVTPKKKTNGAVEITVNQAADDTYKAGSATFTVNIANSTPKTGAWELTALADLEEGDVFVIVGNNGNNYAMSNDNGTGSAPAAVAVTVEDDEITSDVDDNIKWNISGDATNGYTFYPNGDTDNWLYCNNTNNGVRVGGTNSAKTFVIDSESGYLVHQGTSRYVGIYQSQDWRCYTSINSNIVSQTFAFYKYVDGTTPQKANPELAFSPSEVNINFGDQFTAPTLSAAAGFDGTVEYSSSDETVAFVTDTETGDLNIIGGGTTVITATFAGNDTFKSGSASYTLTVTDNRIATTITQENITLDITEVGTLTQLTPVVKDADENEIAYTYEGFPPTVSYDLVSDENGIIGSMDYNSGEITLNGVVGTATLKAYYNIYNVNDTYKPSECTFTITVADLNGPGTENNPYTVDEAIAATPTTAEVYIKGIVSSFYNTSIVGDGSNYRYYISDDGTTATQLLVYKGKGLNNTAFANADDLLVGDEVVIYGKLVTYQNAPEVASGNYLISLNRPVVTTPSIDLSTTTINAPSDGANGTIDVTYNNITDVAAEVYLCDVNGDPVNGYDWLTAEINDQNNVDYTIVANTGEARTAYMMVYALDDEANDVYSDIITITQAAYVDPAQMTTYTLATSITPGKHYIITNGTDAAIGEQKTNNRAAVDITIENGTATVASDAGVSEFIIYGPDANNHYTIYDTTADKDGYLYAAAPSNNNMKLQYTNNINGKWTIEFGNEGVASVVADESSNRNVMRYNASSSIFSCYAENNNQADVYLFEKDNDTAVETTATVTFNSAGYATFASKNTLDFLDAENANYSAWQITSAGATDITFDQINTTVKAGTGILLKGEAGTTATLNILPLGGSDLTNSNKLVGITTETDIEADTYYGLKGKEFVRLTAGTVPAGKAILPAALISSNAPMLSFIFNDGETTKINLNVNDNLDQNAPRYNMAGQRVSNSYKGIVIVNGKKVVIK